MTLSYPRNADQADFVAFDHFEYKSNRSGRSSAPPAMGNAIRLYMPTSTPSVTNKNMWQTMQTLDGALGQGQLDLATAGGSAQSVPELIGNIKNVITNNPVERTKDMFYQGAVMAGAGILQMQPNHITQLGQGKIFNPNAEIAYDGPGLRQFSMQFDFIPKSQLEANDVQKIIMEFKKWSSASGANQNMYEVPHLWSVTYVSKGRVDVMNRFKTAALTSVTTQANPTSDMHATFTDGFPVATSLKLDFRENDVILREDHDEAGEQGF